MSNDSPSRSCFAIMPIREPGTSDYAHFYGIYEQIRQVLQTEGFNIVRADEVTEEGSIAKDIITRLATADLVVADLTDLNPNVFWELGVRHTLRAAGTLLLIDETRTEQAPFDLGYLRLLKYRGTVEGLGDLRNQLTKFVRTMLTNNDQVTGSPVHDWLRHLPPDLSLPASESEAVLRSEIGDYRDQLQRYARRFGTLDDQDIVELDTPAERMRRMQRLANAGRLPAQMVRAIATTAEHHDIPGFIEGVSDAIDHRVEFAEKDIMRLSSWADTLDLGEVTEAVLAYGEALHPTDEHIARARLAKLARSRNPGDRRAAREGISRLVGYDLVASEFVRSNGAPKHLERADFELIAYLTSSLHADGLTNAALSICEAFAREYPDRASVLRLLGRAQEWDGDLAGGTETMQLALQQPDVDDTTTTWLGNTYHNCGRHADAIEMYLVSCWIDSDDSRWFAHCADELSFALCDPYAMYDPHSPVVDGATPRALPTEVTTEAIHEFASYALSTQAPSAEAFARVEDALHRAEIDIPTSDLLSASQGITRAVRRRGVALLYQYVRSDLTRECPARARPTNTVAQNARDSDGGSAGPPSVDGAQPVPAAS